MAHSPIPNRMLAAVLVGPDQLELREVETPQLGTAEVLIRVEACALCASDVSLIHQSWEGQPPYGKFIPGHEYAGTIVALGETVDEFQVGQRVSVEAHLGCLRCLNCRRGDYTACLNYGNRKKGHRANGFTSNGGYAQYVVNHINTVYPIADSVPIEEASLVTNVGCVIYGLETLATPVAGETVVVIGPGPIGLVTVNVLRALGAGRVILVGTRQERLDVGRQLGADLALLSSQVDPVAAVLDATRRGGGYVRMPCPPTAAGADIVIECSGNPQAPQEAVEMVRRAGKILLLSFPSRRCEVDLGRVAKNNVVIYSVRGEGRVNCRRAVSLLDTGRLNLSPIITHTFPLHEIHKAFETFTDRNTNAIKVVVKPTLP